MQIGFKKFLECLDLYLDLLENPIIDESRVKIYNSITLENKTIIRATSDYHNKAWFSNIAILMDSEESDNYISDKGICYGQVIYYYTILNINII
jgi:hypothetical protein